MELHVEQGTLLAAGPDMLDPNFMHTVVLICQHTAEGAYGLAINRRSEHDTSEVLSDELPLGDTRAAKPMRNPVQDPGPSETAIAARSRGFRPFC